MGAKKECCQRCGDDGPDLRTLHMACFYQMKELGLPFDEYRVIGESCPRIGTKTTQDKGMSRPWETPVYKKPTGRVGAKQPHSYYTLRVCKDCRASWMDAIRDWFTNGPKEKEPSCGSGIFVHKNGALVEVTEAEWYAENPDREPVRVRR